jgi:hypothetical protein
MFENMLNELKKIGLRLKNSFRRAGVPIDPVFYNQVLLNMQWKTIQRKTVALSSLRAHVYTSDGDSFIPIPETPASKYLRGDKEAYAKYHNFENEYNKHNYEDYEKLITSIRDQRYKKNDLIVVFNDENIIRDGQHRAAILWHLHGDITIDVANVLF